MSGTGEPPPPRRRRGGRPVSQILDVLGPESILEYGYALYVAGEEAGAATPNARLALKLSEDLLHMKAASDGAARAYLSRAQQIALSLGAGLRSRREEYRRAQEAAERFRSEALGRVASDKTASWLWSFAFQAVTAAGIGAMAVQVALPLVPGAHAHAEMAAGAVAPSALASFVAVALARFVSGQREVSRIRRILFRYEMMKAHADSQLRRGRAREYKRADTWARVLWKEYTKAKIGEGMSFAQVFEEDAAEGEARERELLVATAGPVARLADAFLSWRARRARRKLEKIGAVPPSAAG